MMHPDYSEFDSLGWYLRDWMCDAGLEFNPISEKFVKSEGEEYWMKIAAKIPALYEIARASRQGDDGV